MAGLKHRVRECATHGTKRVVADGEKGDLKLPLPRGMECQLAAASVRDDANDALIPQQVVLMLHDEDSGRTIQLNSGFSSYTMSYGAEKVVWSGKITAPTNQKSNIRAMWTNRTGIACQLVLQAIMVEDR